MMPHHRAGHIQAAPTRDPRAQPEFRIVGEHEEVFVEPANLVQHGFAEHGGAAIRPQAFLDALVLPAVDLAGAAAAVLAIRINQVSGFIDAPWILKDQHFGGGHTDVRCGVEGAAQVGEKVRRGLGIVVQQGDERAPRGGEGLIVGGAKAPVIGVGDDARAELRTRHFSGTIARAIIYYDDFEADAALGAQRREAGPQVIAPVPIDYGHRDIGRRVSVHGQPSLREHSCCHGSPPIRV